MNHNASELHKRPKELKFLSPFTAHSLVISSVIVLVEHTITIIFKSTHIKASFSVFPAIAGSSKLQYHLQTLT